MLSQQLILGSTYRVKFKGAFERHGVCSTPGLTCLHQGNGVFRIEQISSFRDLVLAGIKLYDVFFAPLGISEDDYRQYFDDKPTDVYEKEYVKKIITSEEVVSESTTDPDTNQLVIKKHNVVTGHEVFVESGKSYLKRHAKDSVNYANYPIYKLVDVIDPNDVIYAPELTIDGFPEIQIDAYKDLSLVFRLGLFDDVKQLDPMLLAIRDCMAVYGVRPKNIKMYSTGSKWLNKDEYEKLKLIRLPASIETIPASASYTDYQNRKPLMGGVIKQLVEHTSDVTDTTNQVAFDALKTRSQVLDNRLFLTDVKPGDTFSNSRVYYEEITWGTYTFWRLMDGVSDCPPGEEIMRFSACPTGYTGTKYRRVPGDYVLLGMNEYRDPSKAWDESTTITDDTLYYWVKEVSSVDGVPNTSYRAATSDDIADTKLPLYRRLLDNYVEDATGTYYSESRFTSTGSAKGTGRFRYENYATADALGLMGFKFEYTNKYSQTKSLTLELADIIDFGTSVQDSVTLKCTLTSSGQANPTAVESKTWAKYADRIIQYDTAVNVSAAHSAGDQYNSSLEYFTVNSQGTQYTKLNISSQTEFSAIITAGTAVYDGVSVTVQAIIPTSPDPSFVGISGDILGQNGSVSKEIYFCDNSEIKRNYYMRYNILAQEYATLQNRCNELEKYIISIKTN